MPAAQVCTSCSRPLPDQARECSLYAVSTIFAVTIAAFLTALGGRPAFKDLS